MLYRRGGALGLDLAQSYCWLTISGENGFAAALTQRDMLMNAGLLTGPQMTEARRLIKEYRDRHPRQRGGL